MLTRARCLDPYPSRTNSDMLTCVLIYQDPLRYVHTEKLKDTHLCTALLTGTRILTPHVHNIHASTGDDTLYLR